ncbi:hypothetical protein QBC38DRAFT_452496 [Podospora fimiseda]|uniref:Zn(2)-C6 fungal-type domain-containing protein n=1 Tax=Podospora fimiseda TaxID=252190 RepID=A0AAN7BVD2_9PEZI|nr:hypothetical protein QBC38DRAFT_452496 [Podospora fimiseda]
MTSPATPASGSPGSPDGIPGFDPAASAASSPPPTQPQTAKFGCINCREQHLKCDRITPKCGTCSRSNRECRPTGLKIRLNGDVSTNGKLNFAANQKWVKTPKRLVFIDETKSIMRDASSPGSGADDFDDTVLFEATVPSAVLPPPVLTPMQFSSSTYSSAFDSGPRSPSDRFLANSTPAQPVPQEPFNWPLPLENEAKLIRHFVQHLAHWLDLCDPCRSFETLVPERARNCPMLLNAILSFSATHVSQTQDPQYNQAALEYHLRCIEHVQKSLQNQDDNQEDHFAAAIILRVIEEMEGTRTNFGLGIDHGRVLIGIRSFVKDFVNRDQALKHGSLGAASFWVGLRQEIYRAVMDKKKVEISLEHSLVNKTISMKNGSASGHHDYNLANQAIVHCAKVLNFVFGPREERTFERWKKLHNEGLHWKKHKSASFTPFAVDQDQSKSFPEIWFLRSCHVIGMQHALLAEAFLECNNLRRNNMVDASNRVQELVRQICGIGLGNHSTAPSMFTACMAISAFGEYFTEPRDQLAMLDILRATEKSHARPTEQIQNDMRKKWNWT